MRPTSGCGDFALSTRCGQKLAECLANDPEPNRQWRRNVKLLHDPRIVPLVGNFMCRFSIDEVPQLWNIVNGTMSLLVSARFPSAISVASGLTSANCETALRTGLRDVAGDGAQRWGPERTRTVRYLLHPELVVMARHLSIGPNHFCGFASRGAR
jgi:hypothetical protein